MKKIFLLLLLLIFSLSTRSSASEIRFDLPCPTWMEKQIRSDLVPYSRAPLSIGKMDEVFKKYKNDWCLVKFTIKDNQIFIDHCLEYKPDINNFLYRARCFY